VSNPGNPEKYVPKAKRVYKWGRYFVAEEVKPKGYFDPLSFRTLCPECPDARCAKCPPELYPIAHRVIIGCPKGNFVAGVCQVGTETHVVYHPTEEFQSPQSGSCPVCG